MAAIPLVEILRSDAAQRVANCPALERARLVRDVNKVTGRVTVAPEAIGCAAGVVPDLTITKDGIVCKGGPCTRE